MAPSVLKTVLHGGGLVAKSCPALATPWIVAHQAPLSMAPGKNTGVGCHAFLQGIISVKMNEKHEKELLKAFTLFDDDDAGSVSLNNIKRVAKKPGEELTEEEFQEMLDDADNDGDGEIKEEEFLKVMQKTTLY